MATIGVPLLVAIIGALMYALSTTNSKTARMGEISFFVGMLWLVHELSGHALHF